MFATDDTIVAVATPPGRGGLGVVRLSGPDAASIAASLLEHEAPLAPRHATLARATGEGAAAPVDEVLVTFFPGPGSYTGEDVVEISGHGSPVVLGAIVRRAMAAGARHAERGEFTLRAFLNGRLDLIQAEAVADLVDAVTPLQARAAFDQLQGTLTGAIGAIERDVFDLTVRLEASVDFPDEGDEVTDRARTAADIEALAARVAALLADARRGRVVREGCQATILGTTNTGKSSLFNQLTGAARAIVTPVPGTTRDLIRETIEIGGLAVELVDSAGLRASGDIGDEAEREGVSRAWGATAVADLVLLVLDRSRAMTPQDEGLLERTRGWDRLLVVNKIDLGAAWDEGGLAAEGAVVVRTSAKTGEGMDELREAIAAALVGEGVEREPPAVTNIRHAGLLAEAHAALGRAAAAARAGGSAGSEEFVLADLREARAALETITGARAADELLAEIFARFCIGK